MNDGRRGGLTDEQMGGEGASGRVSERARRGRRAMLKEVGGSILVIVMSIEPSSRVVKFAMEYVDNESCF